MVLDEVGTLVAVVNSSEDVRALIAETLESFGYVTVMGHVDDFKHGRTAIESFLDQHDPRVVVWDVSPPYVQNWAFVQDVINGQAGRGRGWVVTTTNKDALDSLVGRATGAIELVGKPFDLEEIAGAVVRAERDTSRR